MALRITCPGCKTALHVGENLAGKKVRCTACGAILPMPEQSSQASQLALTPSPSVPVLAPASTAAHSESQLPAQQKASIGSLSWLIALAVLVVFGGFVLALVGGVVGVVLWLNHPASSPPIAQPSLNPESTKSTNPPAPKMPVPVRPAIKPANFNIGEVRKSVVHVALMSMMDKAISSGNGFLVSTDGLIYTDARIIQGAPNQKDNWVLVGVPYRFIPEQVDFFHASVVFRPPPEDNLNFAVLKITSRPQYGAFAALPLAVEVPARGDRVAALDFRDVLRGKFATGTISDSGAVIDGRKCYTIDATNNVSNTGGPLVNEWGEAVGIVTLPSNPARNTDYALRLSDMETAAALRPEQLARANPEIGPMDPIRVGLPSYRPGDPRAQITSRADPGEVNPPSPQMAKGVTLAVPPDTPELHKPAPLQGDSATVYFPSPARSMCVGGDGRFLIAHLPTDQKIAVFDVNEARIVKYLPAPADNLMMAAGMDKLIVVVPGPNTIERWSLTTFQKEASGVLPSTEPIVDLGMGSATAGPLVIGGFRVAANTGCALTFVDIDAFKEVWIERRDGGPGISFDRNSHLRVSPDGQLIGVWRTIGIPMGLEALTVKGNLLRMIYGHINAGPALPGADGQTLLTNRGLFSADLENIGDPANTPHAKTWKIPALQGPFYVTLSEVNRGPNRPGTAMKVYRFGDDHPLADLSSLDAADDLTEWYTGVTLPLDQHVFLIPDANLLAVLPVSRDRLMLYHLDLNQQLAKAAEDYLFVSSRPKTNAIKGALYTYQIAVKSNRGVKYKLETAPTGMEISVAGKLTWAVPADFAEREAAVSVTITSESGQTIRHQFTVAVGQKTEGSLAPKPDAPKPAPLPSLAAAKEPPPLPVLKVAPLTEEREERALPSAADAACVGGGGRFLIFHLPKERMLAIFDTNEAKIVKYLAFNEAAIAFAANRDKLIVVLPAANKIQRYNLTTREREVEVAGPADYTVRLAVMGSASRGPLLLGGEKGPRFLDPYTLKGLPEMKLEGHFSVWPDVSLRFSGDGRMLTSFKPKFSPQDHTIHLLQGNTFKPFPMHSSAEGLLAPGAEGRFTYTSRGVYTNAGTPVGKHGSTTDGSRFCVPAVEGEAFYLRINAPGFPKGDVKTAGRLYLHLVGDDRELAEIEQAEVPTGLNASGEENYPTDKRLFLIPSAKLLVILSRNQEKLLLYRVDVDKILEMAERDYLAVLSTPPECAVRGKPFTYAPVVKAKKGGVTIRLDSGPDGMKVTDDGRLTWDVPRDFAAAEAHVILTVRDTAGREVFHTLRLSIVE